MSTMFGLQQKDIDQIKTVFAKHAGIRDAILYGSRALGTFRNASDIDLTLVTEGISFSELLQIELELDDLLLPYKIDLSQRHLIENESLQDHISRVGTVFYRRGLQ